LQQKPFERTSEGLPAAFVDRDGSQSPLALIADRA